MHKAYFEILVSLEGLVTEMALVRSEIAVSNAVGPKSRVSRIHSPTDTARELYPTMVILVPVQIGCRLEPTKIKRNGVIEAMKRRIVIITFQTE